MPSIVLLCQMFFPLAGWELHSLREEREVMADVGKSTIQVKFSVHEGGVGGQRLQTEAPTAYDVTIATCIVTCHPISM